MKKIILIVSIIGLLLLCSCSPNETNDESSNSSQAQSSASESITQSESSIESESEKEQIESYLDIPRYSPSGFSDKHFVISDSSYVLSIEMPIEWDMERKSSTNTIITRLNNEIGRVVEGSPTDLGDWGTIATRDKTRGIMQINEYVEQKTTVEGVEYRYRWRYFYEEYGTEREINFIVTCAEVPELSTYRMLSRSSINLLKTTPNFGILSKIKPQSILIFGNSFVGTSQIGSILQEMMNENGKNVEVTAISRGMANIGIYANDEYFLDSLMQGQYDLVVAMGFYTNNDTLSLSIIKDAATIGGASVITLPAYNEMIGSAREASEDCAVTCLEWKTELEILINGGVDKWKLCYNDDYLHSTPLAGYVGAHMIYRALYSEAPTARLSSSIDQYLIDEVLADYALTGIASSVPLDEINKID